MIETERTYFVLRRDEKSYLAEHPDFVDMTYVTDKINCTDVVRFLSYKDAERYRQHLDGKNSDLEICRVTERFLIEPVSKELQLFEECKKILSDDYGFTILISSDSFFRFNGVLKDSDGREFDVEGSVELPQDSGGWKYSVVFCSKKTGKKYGPYSATTSPYDFSRDSDVGAMLAQMLSTSVIQDS